MDGLMEKVTGIAILAVLILLFIFGVFTPFKNNQKVMATTNDKMVSTLQAELKTAQTEAGVTP